LSSVGKHPNEIQRQLPGTGRIPWHRPCLALPTSQKQTAASGDGGSSVMKLNKVLVGVVFGIVGAVWHLFWSFLVWVGWAQASLDFIFTLHFITPPYKIAAFDFITAALLITVVFVLWFVLGFIAAAVWNIFHRQ
jgi:hypothetical protein